MNQTIKLKLNSMKKNTLLGALLCLSNLLFSSTVTYIPSYNSKGQLDIPQFNNAILLTALQGEGQRVDLVIPPGEYNLPNDKTININNLVNLKCHGVIFKYQYESDYTLDLIHFQDRTKAGIDGLTLDLTKAYNDNKPTYKNADKFVNRAVIQVEHSDSVILENITIKKILGAGIELANSSNCIIRNCNIAGSWVYGNEFGVAGYSINLVGLLTKNNVIKSNILKDSRHQIILQYLANNNLIDSNKCYDAKALKKIWFIEIMDKELTYSCSLHGNGSFDNTISNNYFDHRLSIDNIKKEGNGKGNKLIGNTINGLLDIQSVSPYYSYNCCQIVIGNKYKRINIEAKDCVVENNIKW